MELATCKVMLHIRLVCASDVFVHVCSLSFAFAIGALRLKRNIIHACVCVWVCVRWCKRTNQTDISFKIRLVGLTLRFCGMCANIADSWFFPRPSGVPLVGLCFFFWVGRSRTSKSDVSKSTNSELTLKHYKNRCGKKLYSRSCV